MRIPLRRCAAGLMVMAGSVLLTSGARAEFITYTVSATVSGSLGVATFTDSLVTLSLTADSTKITTSQGLPITAASTATVTVDGVGTATFTGLLRVFNSLSLVTDFAGFTDSQDTILLATYISSPRAYDLKTAIGPITAGNVSNAIGQSFGTTLGDLTFSTKPFLSTFTATTRAVPEPASLLLLATGAAGLLLLARRRSAATT